MVYWFGARVPSTKKDIYVDIYLRRVQGSDLWLHINLDLWPLRTLNIWFLCWLISWLLNDNYCIENLGKWISMIYELNPDKWISMILAMIWQTNIHDLSNDLANEYPWFIADFDIQISMNFSFSKTKYLISLILKIYFTFRNCLMWYMTALWPCICMKQKPITRQVCILIILLFFMASTANIQPLAERLRDFFLLKWNIFWYFLEV